MKKILFAPIILLISAIIFSFNKPPEKEEIVIAVTADKQTKFDMFQDSKVVKGLTTPYLIKLTRGDSKFIFKSLNSKAILKIEVKSERSTLTADWPIIVLLIDDDKMTTFGMD